MKINREKALAAFQEYTDRYDSSRDMIRLKIEHTYRVCGLCQQIARSLDLPEEEVDIAWLTGYLNGPFHGGLLRLKRKQLPFTAMIRQ